MKRRKKHGEALGVPAGTGEPDFHEVLCPHCGEFHSRVKKKKHTKKVAFECKRCTGRWTLTFPGIDEAREAWLRGEDNRYTTFRIPFFRRRR